VKCTLFVYNCASSKLKIKNLDSQRVRAAVASARVAASRATASARARAARAALTTAMVRAMARRVAKTIGENAPYLYSDSWKVTVD